MASNLLNLDTTKLSTGATGSSSKSLYVGNYGGTTPTISIFGGGDSSILGTPLNNLDKIFFHSGYDYLRVKSAVSFNFTLPARNVRTSSGGKKGGTLYNSYNGYSDRFIYQHNYGSPPPAFSMFLNSASSTGGTLLGAGTALAGTVPIQYGSNDSFRMALVYSTDKYLVLRERYQVYKTSLPAVSINATAYFYNNPTSVNAENALSVVHSPLTFNDVSPYGSPIRGRVYETTVTFTAINGGQFDKVDVYRFGGGIPTNNYLQQNPYQIIQVNGSNVTAFDPWTAYQTVSTFGSKQTSWSMRIRVTDIKGTDAIGKNKYVYYTPRYAVRFFNTTTGQIFTDAWGGVISFYISP